jgi:hypothetical protein
LHGFIDGVMDFLKDTLHREDLSAVLWNDGTLHALALETFKMDVIESANQVHRTIEALQSPSTSQEVFMRRISEHGLFGRPMRFKLAVLDSIAKEWERAKINLKEKFKTEFNIRGWFKRMCDAIDAVLDSLIKVVGVGDLIKEFKDSLSALASSDKDNGDDPSVGGSGNAPKSDSGGGSGHTPRRKFRL